MLIVIKEGAARTAGIIMGSFTLGVLVGYEIFTRFG